MRVMMMHRTNPRWEAGATPGPELIARVGNVVQVRNPNPKRKESDDEAHDDREGHRGLGGRRRGSEGRRSVANRLDRLGARAAQGRPNGRRDAP